MAAQGTDEWKQQRCGRINASRFAAAIDFKKDGKSSQKRIDYMMELMCERLTGVPSDPFISYDMKIGTEREPDAKALFGAQTGIIGNKAEYVKMVGHKIGASPDWLIGANGLAEFKCPKRETHLGYFSLADGEAPAEYVPQIQGQMMVTHRKWCYFASYNPEFPLCGQLVVRLVMRDEAYIAQLRKALIQVDHEVQVMVDDWTAQNEEFTFPALPE